MDEETFAAFYQSEWSRLVRRAFLIVGSTTAAEDVVQDAMSEVYRRWSELRIPGAYAFRATVNGALRRLETQRREQPTSLPYRPGSAEQPDYIGDILDGLPPQTRAILVLKFYDGLTEAEIALAVGCRKGTVGPTITRALRCMALEVKK